MPNGSGKAAIISGNRLILLACLAALAGCGGNIRDGKVHGKAAAGQYKRLAEEISRGHKHLYNKKVAVLPFSYPDKRASVDGAIVSEKLLTLISQKKDLEVVERGLLERVLAELKLQRSGVMDERSIRGLGKILGVEAIVTGTLTRHKDGRIEINARLIKTESAEVLAAAAETIMPEWETASAAGFTATKEPPRGRRQPAPAAAVPFTAAERRNCPPGMVAYWNFDSASETAAADVFGGNEARLYGPRPTGEGRVNSALDFSGSDYLKVSRPESGITTAITVEAWVKYRRVNFGESGSGLFCRSGAYWFGISGADNPDTNIAVYLPGISRDPHGHLGQARLQPDTWYHLAFTYDGSSVRIYLNGEVDSSFNASGPLGRGTDGSVTGWHPGAVSGYHTPLDGIIDEIAVYDRALSRAELAGHYQKGLRGKGYCAI